MKTLRYVFVLSVWFVLCVPFAFNPSLFAQNPQGKPRTIVIQEKNGWWSNFEWDGDKTLLWYTSEPDWGISNVCSGEPISTDTILSLTRIVASGKFSNFFKGPLQARLYYPATIDDVFPIEKACSFLSTVQPAAEGIIHGETFVQNGSQYPCPFGTGPGRNQLMIRLSGSLYNISMPCPGRQVSLNLEQHFQLKQGAIVDPDTCSTDFSNIEVIKYVMDVHCLP